MTSQAIPIRDYISHKQVTIHKEDAITHVVELLVKTGLTGSPVVDDSNHVIGFISEHDCMKKVIGDTYFSQDSATAQDLMQNTVTSISSGANILQAADLLEAGGHRLFPVVDNDNRPVGILTRGCILKGLMDHYQSNVV